MLQLLLVGTRHVRIRPAIQSIDDIVNCSTLRCEVDFIEGGKTWGANFSSKNSSILLHISPLKRGHRPNAQPWQTTKKDWRSFRIVDSSVVRGTERITRHDSPAAIGASQTTNMIALCTNSILLSFLRPRIPFCYHGIPLCYSRVSLCYGIASLHSITSHVTTLCSQIHSRNGIANKPACPVKD